MSTQQILFLPATAPGDTRYGCDQEEWPLIQSRFGGVSCTSIRFDTMVWYNRQVRNEGYTKMVNACGGDLRDLIVVGFSKSGCGAINFALDYPNTFKAVVVFDAPLVNEDIHRFHNLDKFYPSTQALQEDVPLRRIRNGQTFGKTSIVLIHGEEYSDEMNSFFAELKDKGGHARVLSDIAYPHSWNSGWVVPALENVLGR